MDWLKALHIITVVLSITGFTIRGVAMMLEQQWYKSRTSRTLSATNDTILLVSALFLADRINQWPFIDNWLTAKVVALLAYIGFGMVALHFGNSKRVRIVAWMLALLCVIYIVMTARYRHPFWFDYINIW